MSEDSILYSFVGGLLAVTAEFIFKKWGTSYVRIAWCCVPLALAINYCIYRAVRNSPSLPAFTAVFGSATLGMRVLLSLWQGWPIGVGTWIATALLFLALAARLWRP